MIENEFGEISIDTDLVEENLAAREDIITLGSNFTEFISTVLIIILLADNGCVCCSVRGDLVRTFSMLVSRRKEFDCIIIETTGMVT